MLKQANISKYSRIKNGVLYYHLTLISAQLSREPGGYLLDANIWTVGDLVNIVQQLKKSFGVKKVVLITEGERPRQKKFLPRLTGRLPLKTPIPKLADPDYNPETSDHEYGTFPTIKKIGLIGYRFHVL